MQCGSPLMIVVYPPSVRHEETITPSYYEDHLLERVSLLELRLVQVSESLAMALDIIREQSQLMREEHQMIKILYQSLELLDADEKTKVKKSWDKALKSDKSQTFRNSSQIIEEILFANESPNTNVLDHLLREAIENLQQNEEEKALDVLERAVKHAPKNVPLLLFSAEQLFYADKFDSAGQNLENALKLAPENEKILLLRGAIYADEAEIEKARKLLSSLPESSKIAFCSHFILGMTAAFEGNWSEAVKTFSKALEISSAPEIEYLTACAFFQAEEYEKALEYLQKANAADERFADAWFMQSFVFAIQDQKEAAENAVKKAFESCEAGAQCMEYFKGKEIPEARIALPFYFFKKTKKRLLTGGSLRLRKFFRSQIFQALNQT